MTWLLAQNIFEILVLSVFYVCFSKCCGRCLEVGVSLGTKSLINWKDNFGF